MLPVVLEQNLILPAVFFHASGHEHPLAGVPIPVVQSPQRTPQYQPIKPAHHSRDLFPVFFDKLLHGVLLCPVSVIWTSTTRYYKGERPFSDGTVCGEAALCHPSPV